MAAMAVVAMAVMAKFGLVQDTPDISKGFLNQLESLGKSTSIFQVGEILAAAWQRQPRCPSMGLASFSSVARRRTRSTGTPAARAA